MTTWNPWKFFLNLSHIYSLHKYLYNKFLGNLESLSDYFSMRKITSLDWSLKKVPYSK